MRKSIWELCTRRRVLSCINQHVKRPPKLTPHILLPLSLGRRGLATTSSSGGGALYHTLYKNVFRSNIAYLTYVFAGAIAVEWVYSKGIDTAWELSNSGVRLVFLFCWWGEWSEIGMCEGMEGPSL